MAFLNYATLWIKQYIINHITATSRTIRAPAQQIYNVSKIQKFIKKFKEEHNRPPSEDEISEAVGISINNVILAQASYKFQLSIDRTMESDEENTSFKDVIPSKDETVEDHILADERRKVVWKYVDKLPEREALILSRYFGRDGFSWSLENIADDMNLNRERIRQLLKHGLKLMRTRYKDKLLPYL